MSEWLSNLSDLESMTAGTVYLVVLVIVFVESGLLVGFFLPGDTVLFTAGLLAADPDRGLSLPLLAGGVFVAAVSGDAVGYWSGRRLGRPWLVRRAGRAAANVERAERFYARYGSLAVVVARFIPWVRTFTPIVAGVGRMPYPRFLAANLAGALIWGVGITTLGYVAYSDPGVRRVAFSIAGTAVVLSILVPVAAAVRRRLTAGRRAPEGTAGPAAEPSER
jgi:membrane-associated protein